MSQALSPKSTARSPKKTRLSSVRNEAVEKLKSSGLASSDLELLRITPLSATEVIKYVSQSASAPKGPALYIAYYTPDGDPVIDPIIKEPFYRLRFLSSKLTGFQDLTKKPLRYMQPPNTLPSVYYPQNIPNWPEICQDPAQPLIITEGELKAAKACKEGFPAIGLGGVSSWKSHKAGINWLAPLDYIVWSSRSVYIVFDSDYRTNSQVLIALKELADSLQDRGSFVYIVSLPSLPEVSKTGLDDFFVYSGPSAVTQFNQLLHEAEPYGFTKVLFDLNNRYTYIRDPGIIIDKKYLNHKISVKTFKESLEINRRYTSQLIKPDGTFQYKIVSAASHWLEWPLRHNAQKLTYAPGLPLLTDNAVNTWEGWGVLPIRNRRKLNIRPFLGLLNHIFTGASPKAKRWFLQWCAYPLQHPGTKLFTSVVVHGIRHGTGKSLIGYTLARIYGKNFTEINQNDLHDDYNAWAESKQFVMGDDVTGSNKRRDADYLKKLITQKEIRINIKYVPQYTVPDCINYYFTSQHPDSFFLEDDDRRFFIHEVTVGPLSEEFYKTYMEWLNSDGASHLFRYLLDLDLTGFNPSAAAFRTDARERMIELSHSDLAGWVRTLINNPDYVLKEGRYKIQKDLFTSRELLYLYDPESRTGTTANGLARELSRAGLQQVAGGRPIRTADGQQGRYYAVRNQQHWIDSAPMAAEIAKYLDSVTATLKGSFQKDLTPPPPPPQPPQRKFRSRSCRKRAG